MADFDYSPLLPTSPDDTPYRHISSEHVKRLEVDGRQFIKVAPEGLTLLAQEAMADVSHLLRPSHLAQLKAILDDPEATNNDRFVAPCHRIMTCCSAPSLQKTTHHRIADILIHIHNRNEFFYVFWGKNI